MAFHFGANQYDDAFVAKRLQQYHVPKQFRERPNTHHGFTNIVANNGGHLLPGVARSRENPFGNFVGTWDMPLKIPGNHYGNTCARSIHGVMKLSQQKDLAQRCLNGQSATASPKIRGNPALLDKLEPRPDSLKAGHPIEKIMSPISPIEPRQDEKAASLRGSRPVSQPGSQRGGSCCGSHTHEKSPLASNREAAEDEPHERYPEPELDPVET